MSRTGRRRRAAAGAAGLGLVVVAGCGGGHPRAVAPAATTTVPTTVAPTTTVAPPTVAPLPIAPLTGLGAPAAITARPAVVVKIDNVDDARPQSGVNQADVVYEEMVEGGLTRLAAVFQTQRPAMVGPIRSGRTTDLGIIGDLDKPVLAYAGANASFLYQLMSSPAINVNPDLQPSLFYRGGTHAAPHNLFANANALAARSPSGSGPPPALFTYRAAGQAAGAGATPTSRVTVFFPESSATWTWLPARGVWARSQNGTADVDTAGVGVTAANVVVQPIGYRTALIEGNGTPIPVGDLVGSGQVWVLTNGSVVAGAWARQSLTATSSYDDSAGQPIRLTPGQTWVELTPTGYTPSFTH